MANDPSDVIELKSRMEAGDERALVEFFFRRRDQLKRMVKLRMDRRLQGRVDASDILQEAVIEVGRRAKEYVHNPKMQPFLWLRWITGETLLAVHRRHSAQMRDVAREISLRTAGTPPTSSVSLAEMLMGKLTSPTLAARRAELQLRLQEILNAMEPIDREILAAPLRRAQQPRNRRSVEDR